MKPPVMILHATGTNRDRDAAKACELAGGEPEIVHLHALLAGERDLMDYRFLVIPGGFSYGDDLGAGQIAAASLRHRLREPLERFVASGRPVLGVCNGFQILVKSGLLPGPMGEDAEGAFGPRRATLTRNASGRFECRWVHLEVEEGTRCVFTEGLRERIFCPVAHGEGRFAVSAPEVEASLEAGGQVALRYVNPDGETGYPHDPNGSVGHIAGICNRTGTVMGMMPHPEDHITWSQHPRFHRGESGGLGLALFERAIRYASQV